MSSGPCKLYPLEWYGIKNVAAPGVGYKKRQCAGEVNYGFGNKRQCRNKPGHGERGLFCERHQNLKAKPEVTNE